MKKSKILISAVTMFSLCITPMSVYAQVDPNSNIENTISQTKSAENLPTPVLQEKEIEVSNGTGYSLNNIQGAETVKALEQGTIVISYKATGENRVPLTEIATTSYGTQLSVINYSQPIDGKPAIILSAPNATNGRKNGKIWIGLINETGQSGVNKYSVEWKYCYSVDTPQMGYSYSCLTELPDGKVGLLYEKYDSWSRNELHLKNILKYEKFTIDELKVQP